MKLEILDELRELIPPLQPEELERLHKSLDVEGRAIDPLIVWEGKNIIVDGHNRYIYCTEKSYPFQIHEKSFSSLDVVKNYMVIKQLGRRNLDPKTASILRGKLYNWRKQDVPNREGLGGKSGKIVNYQNDSQQKSPTTAEEIAKETGVSPITVMRDGMFAEACAFIEESVSSGEISSEQGDEILAKGKNGIVAEAKQLKKKDTHTTKPPEPKKRPSDTTEKAWEIVFPIYEKGKDTTSVEKFILSFTRLKSDDQVYALEIIQNYHDVS
jgi:hypothetical protein